MIDMPSREEIEIANKIRMSRGKLVDILHREVREKLADVTRGLSSQTKQDAILDILSAVSDLFTNELLKKVLSEEVNNFSRSRLYRVSAPTGTNGSRSVITIFENEILSASLLTLSGRDYTVTRDSENIRFDHRPYVVKVLKGSVNYSLWKAPETNFFTSLDRLAEATKVLSGTLETGQKVVVPPSRAGLAIDSVFESTVFLYINSKYSYSPIVPLFKSNAKSNAGLVRVSSSDSSASRIQMMVAFLRSFCSKSQYFEITPRLLEHTSYFVRWETMRGLLSCDRKGARPYLVSLCNDSHPEIAALATKCLDELY